MIFPEINLNELYSIYSIKKCGIIYFKEYKQ